MLSRMVPVSPGKGTQVVEPYAMVFHSYVGLFTGNMPDVKGLMHHKMMDGMSPAEEKAEQLEW